MCRCRGVEERHGFTLDDLTGSYTPAEWGGLLVAAYHAFRADRIVAETNYSGTLVEANLRSADGGSHLPFIGVHARQGKALRAEPVSALTEQGKDHHVGAFAHPVEPSGLDGEKPEPTRREGLRRDRAHGRGRGGDVRGAAGQDCVVATGVDGATYVGEAAALSERVIARWSASRK